MKSFVVALCVFAVAAAIDDKDSQALQNELEVQPDGAYRHFFETDKGSKSSATGFLKTDAKGEGYLAIEGSYEYVGNDGQTYRVTYVADETGFHPKADFLPTPPAPEPIPEYIEKSLIYIKEHPYKEPQVY